MKLEKKENFKRQPLFPKRRRVLQEAYKALRVNEKGQRTSLSQKQRDVADFSVLIVNFFVVVVVVDIRCRGGCCWYHA